MFPIAVTRQSHIADRRWSFFAFAMFWWAFGGILMAARISAGGWTMAKMGLFALFLALLAQAVYGFALAVTGWYVLRRGGDPLRIGQLPPAGAPAKEPSTAIVIPIYNEDVGRVFSGLRVMYDSLQAAKRGGTFDFYILSDSSDPNVWVAEEEAWFKLCQETDGFGHIFYRKRRMALHHKSGNVADFCRRWGNKYEYLIVLDADSVMSGRTLARLVDLMEHHPRAGIIQTYSRMAMGRSLFQRVAQFAAHAYGPLFVAGANYWQLDNANFFGHNAIIRLRPFMRYCAMPELPPTGKLGTRILSHDTVEAALIRRAGYEVWSEYDLDGSYEESPPHLLPSLQRDRRWCHGNMQHAWFLFARGLTGCSRLNILIGIMAYASSPLWLLFLLFSPLLYVAGPYKANNTIPFLYIMCLLLLPKLLAALHLMSDPERRRAVGGRAKILVSTAGETVYSMLLAPVLMLFYTRFVWNSFFGSPTGWGRQKRADDSGPTWRECAQTHLAHTLLALGAGVAVAWLFPAMLPWFCLVLAGPLVAIPFDRMIASNKLGDWARRRGWFLIPEETQPPAELRLVQSATEAGPGGAAAAGESAEDFGLGQTVLDPRMNAIHVSLLRERQIVPLRTHAYLAALCDRLLRDGPGALQLREKKILLWDADSMQVLHQKLWSSPERQWHAWWRVAFGRYRQGMA